MSREVVFTEDAPKAIGPYSQGVKANGFLFCSGQIAINPQTGELITGSISEQTRQVLSNLKAVIEAAGSSLDKVVKVTVFLKDIDDLIVSIVNQFFNGRNAALGIDGMECFYLPIYLGHDHIKILHNVGHVVDQFTI